MVDCATWSLPDLRAPFILEGYHSSGGYGGVLYNEGAIDAGKPTLVLVGCVSTAKTRILASAVE